jgi:hypothetical protein
LTWCRAPFIEERNTACVCEWVVVESEGWGCRCIGQRMHARKIGGRGKNHLHLRHVVRPRQLVCATPFFCVQQTNDDHIEHGGPLLGHQSCLAARLNTKGPPSDVRSRVWRGHRQPLLAVQESWGQWSIITRPSQVRSS